MSLCSSCASSSVCSWPRTALSAVAAAATMVMAIVLAHWPKVFASDNGLELPLVLLAVAVALALTGPGVYSLDAALGLTVPALLTAAGALLAALGVVAALASRAAPTSAARVTD